MKIATKPKPKQLTKRQIQEQRLAILEKMTLSQKEQIVTRHNESAKCMRTAIAGLALFVSSAEMALDLNMMSYSEIRMIKSMLEKSRHFYNVVKLTLKENYKDGEVKQAQLDDELSDKVVFMTSCLHILDNNTTVNIDNLDLFLAKLDVLLKHG